MHPELIAALRFHATTQVSATRARLYVLLSTPSASPDDIRAADLAYQTALALLRDI